MHLPSAARRLYQGTKATLTSRLHASYHASGCPLDFRKDFVLGLCSSRVRQWALLLRASCDFPLAVDPSEADDEGLDPDIRAGIREYLLAYQRARPHGVALAPGSLNASEEMGFIAGFRNTYLAPHCRYFQLFDCIVNTVNERGGQLHFTLEQVDFFQHFSARAAVELERGAGGPGCSFNQYIAEHTMGSRYGPQGDGLPHASITGLELGMLLEPQGRHHRQAVRFLRADGTELDTAVVRERYAQAAAACSSPENMEYLKRTGQHSEAARQVVGRLQECAHSRPDMLPPAGPLHAIDNERQLARSRFSMPPDGLYSIGEE